MSKDLVVDVTSREERGKNVSRRLRRSGMVPAIVYGEKRPPVPVTVDPKAIKAILASETGENTLFQLRLDGAQGKTRHVMMRERQRHPVSGSLVHIDFIRVDMDKMVEVEVPLHIVGVATGVKNDGGLLDYVVRSIHVRCLPSDIPDRADVNVEEMEIGHVFRAKDLAIDAKVELIDDPEQALVVISAPAKEVEPAVEAAPEAEAEGAPAEGEEKKEEGGESKATEPSGS